MAINKNNVLTELHKIRLNSTEDGLRIACSKAMKCLRALDIKIHSLDDLASLKNFGPGIMYRLHLAFGIPAPSTSSGRVGTPSTSSGRVGRTKRTIASIVLSDSDSDSDSDDNSHRTLKKIKQISLLQRRLETEKEEADLQLALNRSLTEK